MTLAPWRRHLILAALCAGLAAAVAVDAPAGWLPLLSGSAAMLAIVVWHAKLRPAAALPQALAIAALAGVGIGDARLAASDAGAYESGTGERVRASGFVVTQPRPLGGATRFAVETSEGRLGVAVQRPLPDLRVGDRIEVAGRLESPEPWLEERGRRDGWALELAATRAEAIPGARSGLAGYLDRARARAEAGLTAALDPGEAALARGFVLGQDEAIDPLVRDDFRRSGLAHLLAVSGQNVILLALLAGVLLAAIGLEPRMRLAAIVLLIAVYVPIAGSGPSIQRAAVMGAAGICAGLAGRAVDRVWIVLLAVAVTLLLDPLAAGDVGWQLSFAAVIGIALWTSRLAALIGARLAGPDPKRHGRLRRLRGRLARPLAEALALTLAATLATGPLIAHHFGTLSLASLPANLIVVPAVAPAMWLGMLAAGAGQIPSLPTEPLGALSGPLLGYVEWVAATFAAPSWASLTLPEPGLAATVAAYAALLCLMPVVLGWAERRRAGTLAPATLAVAASMALVCGVAVLTAGNPTGRGEPPAPGVLRITAVDVGQGDAILLQQRGRPAVLVDAGPPGAGVADSLRRLGVGRIGALVLTHADLDHSGGIREVLAGFPVDRLLLARPAPEATSAARLASVPTARVAEGSDIRVGRLDLHVLSPRPRAPGTIPAADTNVESIVLAARFGGWSTLLTADAEQEATHLTPGPLDVLKLAHHGSADAGLGAMLATSAPRLALIGVGADNGYGHPDETVLATLAEHGVCVLRSDLDGDAGAEIGPGGLTAFAERGLDATRPGCEPFG